MQECLKRKSFMYKIEISILHDLSQFYYIMQYVKQCADKYNTEILLLTNTLLYIKLEHEVTNNFKSTNSSKIAI